jgi:hypothetical protein
MQAADALTLAVELGKILEAAKLPYAVGGALALGIHGVSRSTQDVDLNIFIGADQLDHLVTVFQASGVQVDPARARAEGLTDGVFFCWAGSTRIDVFLPSIELSWEALRTRISAVVQGSPTWFLSAELLSCFKLLFFRPKDLLDLERLVATAPALDVSRVRALMVETMGEDDERVRAWDDITRRFSPA